jgi:DNA repair protein RadA/Sms
MPAEAPPAQQAPTLAVHSSEIEDGETGFLSTGFEPWDEVLGGGLVLGSSLVFYGDPGCRKTTWAGAIADHVASRRRGRALYLSPEMPSAMVRDTVSRLAVPRALFIIGVERNASHLPACLLEIGRLRPRVVVYDSIQGFDVPPVGRAGSQAAIVETVTLARRLAAQYRHAAILISQVNKAGLPSGPYRTIHDCDVVAHLTFDKVVVKNKNRFAPTPREAALP